MRRKIYREDIVSVGRELMFEKGFNDTGIKDITDKLQIPKGSFYNHFRSKEAFGLEVLQSYMDGGLENYKLMLLNSELSPKNRLKQFYQGFIESYEKALFKLGCLMGNFSTEMADINEPFRQSLDQGFRDQEAVIIQCLKEGQEQGEIDADIDCSLYGSSLINGWHGALVRMKSTASIKPLEDFKKFFLDPL